MHLDLGVGHLGLHFHREDRGIIVAKFNESFKMHSEPMVQQNGSKTVIKCLLFFLNALTLTYMTFQLNFH